MLSNSNSSVSFSTYSTYLFMKLHIGLNIYPKVTFIINVCQVLFLLVLKSKNKASKLLKRHKNGLIINSDTKK